MVKVRATTAWLNPPSMAGPTAELGGPAAYGSFAVGKRIGKLDRALSLEFMKVLDIGCGNGCYTEELAKRADRVYGLDILMANLRAFHSAIPRVQAVAEELPFPSASFDAVTMIEVLEHTASDEKSLFEAYRVLRPGGVLILFVPNKLYPMESHPCHIGGREIGHNLPFVSWMPRSFRLQVCHARIYGRRELVHLLQQAGFKVSALSYIFPPVDSFPLPFKGAYRRISAALEETPLRVFGVSIFAIAKKPAT